MALGTRPERTNLVVLDLKHTDENKKPITPEFRVLRKNSESGKFEQTDSCKNFTGELTGVTTKVKEFKKDGKLVDSKPVVDIFFKDGPENYMLSLGYNIANRGLYNRLLALETFDDLEVNCWRDKEPGKNYLVLTLRQHGATVKGRYSKDQIPVPKEVKLRGQIVRDYQEIDDFFKSKLDELNERIKTSKNTVSKQGNTVADPDSDEDKIPF